MAEDAGIVVEGSPEHYRDTWPFYWISRVNASYVHALERRLRPIGIDVPRWRVLISLYEESYLSVSEISEFSGLKLNTTTKIVQRLIADGMVTTRVRPTDGRVTDVCLTPKGDETRAAALEEARRIRDEAFGNVGADEIAALNAVLERVFVDLSRI